MGATRRAQEIAAAKAEAEKTAPKQITGAQREEMQAALDRADAKAAEKPAETKPEAFKPNAEQAKAISDAKRKIAGAKPAETAGVVPESEKDRAARLASYDEEAEKTADVITGGSVSQAKREQAKATEKPKPERKPYVRTAIKTRNPSKGVYVTLNGQFSIRAGSKAGTWDLYHLEELVEAGVRGWDASLNRIVELGLAKVADLNTPPAKPKPAPAAAKPDRPTEAKEEGVSERRTGSTGTPKKTRGPGEAIHVRKSRATRVG